MVWVTRSPPSVPPCSILSIFTLKLRSNLSLLNICSCCLQPTYLFLIPLERFLISLLRVMTTEVHLSNIKSRMFSKIDTEYCRVYYLLY